MTDNCKQDQQQASFNAAIVLREDLAHIRDTVISPDAGAGEYRRLSAQLRRILVDGDLMRVGAPRTGVPDIISPDVRLIYRSNERLPLLFGFADFFKWRGTICGGMAVREEPAPPSDEYHRFSPELRTALSTSNFIKQRVICWRGIWVTRSDVIKYVANVAHGVHTDIPKKPYQQTIDQLRSSFEVTFNESNIVTIDVIEGAILDDGASYKLKPNKLDVSLSCLLATAQHLVNSPEVQSLEQYITNEIGQEGGRRETYPSDAAESQPWYRAGIAKDQD